jgi:hypothetical protein
MRILRSTALRSLVVVAVAALSLTGVANAGTPTTLKDPSRIASGSLGQLSMAVDSNGRIHIAASRANGNLVYITDRTGAWTEVVVAHGDTVGDVGFTWDQPSLALDENDRVTIAAVDSDWGVTGCDCTGGIFTFSDKGRARGTFPAKGTKRATAGSHSPSIKTVGGHLYLAYRRGATEPEEPAAIRFKTDATGRWTDTRVASFPYAPATISLRIGSDGKARIAFDAFGIQVATAATVAGGFTVQKVPGTTRNDAGAVLSLTSTDRPVVAWTRTWQAPNGARYASRATGTWITRRVSSHVGAVALTLDAADAPFLAVADPAGADAGLWTYAGPTFIEDHLYPERAASPQVRVSGAGIVSLAFVSPAAPKGLYLSQD